MSRAVSEVGVGDLYMGEVLAMFQRFAKEHFGSAAEVDKVGGGVVFCEDKKAKNPGLRAAIEKVKRGETDQFAMLLLKVNADKMRNLGTDNEQPIANESSTHWTALHLKRNGDKIEVRYANSVGNHDGRDDIPEALRRVLSECVIDCKKSQKEFQSLQQSGSDCGYYAVWHGLQMLGVVDNEAEFGIFIKEMKKDIAEERRVEAAKQERVKQIIQPRRGKAAASSDADVNGLTEQLAGLAISKVEPGDYFDDSSDEETANKVSQRVKVLVEVKMDKIDQNFALKAVRGLAMGVLYSSEVGKHLYGGEDRTGLKVRHLVMQRAVLEKFKSDLEGAFRKTAEKVLGEKFNDKEFLDRFFHTEEIGGFRNEISKWVDGRKKGLYSRLSNEKRRLSRSRRSGGADAEKHESFEKDFLKLSESFFKDLELKLQSEKHFKSSGSLLHSSDQEITDIIENVIADLVAEGILRRDKNVLKLEVGVGDQRLKTNPETAGDDKSVVRKLMLEKIKSSVSRKGEKFSVAELNKDVAEQLKNHRLRHPLRNLEPSMRNISTRLTLPTAFTTDSIHNSEELFAHLRLFSRSHRRHIRNQRDLNSEPIISSSDVSYRIVQFAAAGNSEVKETQTVSYNKSAKEFTRGATVDELGSYKEISDKIAESISALKKAYTGLESNDAIFAKWIRSCLKGEKIQIGDVVLSEHQQQMEKMIANITYLLFGTEVIRNPNSIIIHQMMLDLIEGGKMSFKDVFSTSSGNNKWGAMPMSASGAIAAARRLNSEYSEKEFGYRYEYEGTDKAGSDKKKCTITLDQLKSQEFALLTEWLQMKLKSDQKEFSSEQFLSTMKLAMHEWYSSVDCSFLPDSKVAAQDKVEKKTAGDGERKKASPHYAESTKASAGKVVKNPSATKLQQKTASQRK